ncbi:MAG: efflux RND transporter periplasmic adaptor subunit [Bacteroidales bacterium]|nr:efflux RND transporter periplasmic adaptor subunit [Bacteroidales bacterium]
MRDLPALLILSALLLTGCKSASEDQASGENEVYIKVEQVSVSEYRDPIRLTGLLATRKSMKLSFKTGGIVKSVFVREGERVNQGQLLMQLDTLEIAAQARQAAIALQKAERDLTRVTKLHEDSVATLEQLQNVKSACQIARSNKQIADFNISHSRIIAPTRGEIQKLLVQSSEMIAPGYPAILFASTDNDWVVRATLTDKDVVKIAMGDSASILMDAFPGDTLAAEVTEIGAIADPVTGTYEAELTILHPDSRFRAGYISRGWIYPAEKKKAILVPLDALLDAMDRRAYLFVIRKGLPEKIGVTTGAILNDRISIPEGLNEGDSLVTTGAQYISKGLKVIIK